MTAEADGLRVQPAATHRPARTAAYEVSEFLQPSCYQNAQVFLAYSSIGQKCTVASPLQMAMVASGIANGGVIMTPHVMYQIRDSDGQPGRARTSPRPWHQATSPATAAAVTGLMATGRHDGTARGVGFPPVTTWRPRRGRPRPGVGNTAVTDWMIAFAPATQPQRGRRRGHPQHGAVDDRRRGGRARHEDHDPSGAVRASDRCPTAPPRRTERACPGRDSGAT